ncbi:Dolichol-phosphate mannosyltransferase in lipid-linked oligosaccharide synthesis cluster [Salipiger mucosus DSM 16094]|uniref:Dolichol-phosphate mannosyltransferase in lipid-linked oligosaccharide synthesis cluster n=1 Tax=Salipiger mucosus DSM 16094 TaxID=1123237 RepID=S9RWA3_9RHOB|nr:Dolichol-phosphate mannosyltransferase in lipid-linked oligosaccharide synthesis cluster [Salipiger mucosus DSM 16094]
MVLIGRNEGARLVAALAATRGARQVVYVDSGSRDDSVARAREAGATVVELDRSAPFTAARARNAGFAALEAPDLVQFVDGDCALVPGWLDAGRAHLDAHPELALVTGWRAEIHRDASLYNQLADAEWRRPAGQIRACGGDMMVRAAAFRAVGGFDPGVIAAEDDEFCTRLRKTGGQLERLPQEMTRHDADMHHFGQWWRRAVRTGHGFAQVGHLHPDYFVAERRRVLAYALALPLAILLAATFSGWLALAMAALYPLNWWRTAQGLSRDGLPKPEARRQAVLLTLSKFPNLIGMATFHLRRLRRAQMRLIEYK